jgi:hypothetical protein
MRQAWMRRSLRTSALLMAFAFVLAAGRTAAAGQATVDSDGDGMPDEWETFFGLNPQDASDAIADPDGDGLTNLQEFQRGGHPFGRDAHYFAEGALGFFRVDIGLVNPSATDTAKVQLTYLTESGERVTQRVALAPMQRRTITANEVLPNVGGGISTIVESDRPVSADRFMEWGSGGYGSSLSGSAASPSRTWYFAEGATNLFSLYYLLLNPAETPAQVTITYLQELGPPVTRTYTVAAKTRATIVVNDDPALAYSSVAAVVTSDVPIVAERSMYLSSPTEIFTAGAAGLGATQPATSWSFAEGAPGGFFDEFLLIANPGDTPTTATIVYRRADGVSATAAYAVPAQTRRTVYVNDEIANNPALAAMAGSTMSATITAPVPIVAEQTMWWARSGGRLWYESATARGATQSFASWTVVEGRVGGERAEQTYLLIANTGATPGSVRVTALDDIGHTATQTLPMAGFGRLTIDVGTAFGLTDTHVSLFVDSVGGPPLPLVVEYARYGGSDGLIWSAGDTTLATPGIDHSPKVVSTTPSHQATGVPFDTDLSVTFDGAVSVTPSTFTLECPVGTAFTLIPPNAGPATTFSLHPTTHLPFETGCALIVHASEVSNADHTTMADDVRVTFTVGSCPTITIDVTLPSAIAGAAFQSTQFSQSGGRGAITWSIVRGALPAGMTLSATGLLAGTPTLAGDYTFTVRATDANGCAQDRVVMLTVACPGNILVNNPPGGIVTVGLPFSRSFTQTGGGVPTFSVNSGTLPAGVTLSAAGLLAGTPTQTGSFSITVRVGDATGCSAIGAAYAFTIKPDAQDDRYPETVLGNVPIDSGVTGYSVTASNDAIGTATIGAYDATTVHGGSVSMITSGANMGRFTYNPPRGYTGPDSFTYTLMDGPTASDTATVTLTVANRVWFIDNHATCGASCDGRLLTPYATLAAFQAVNDGIGVNPRAGEPIFLYENNVAYDGAMTLLDRQRLYGQDATAVSFAALTGLPVPDGSVPVVPVLSADAPLTRIDTSGVGVTLANGNTLRGLTINTHSSSATGIAGTAATLGDTFMARDLFVQGQGVAVNLANYTADAIFNALSSTGSSTSGIVLSNIRGRLQVVGDGQTPGSGGRIGGATHEGVLITDSTNVSLALMDIQNNGDAGIRVVRAIDLTLDHVQSQSNGLGAGQAAFDADGLYGTVTVTDSTFTTAGDMAMRLRDTSGATPALTFTATRCTFTNSALTQVDKGDAVDIFPTGSASVSYTFAQSAFTGANRDLLHVEPFDSAMVQVSVRGSTFNGYSNTSMTGRGISMFNGDGTAPFNGTIDYTIDNNQITGTTDDAIVIGVLNWLTTNAAASGTITGNTIGRATDRVQGATTGGIYMFNNGTTLTAAAGKLSARIENNLIQHTRNGGIAIYVGGEVTNVNIFSNTIHNFDTIFAIDARVTGPPPQAVESKFCLDIGGSGHPNTITLPLFAYGDFNVDRNYIASIYLPGYTGTPDDSGAVAAFLGSQNNGTGNVTVGYMPGYPGGFYNIASCPTP